MAKDGQLAQAIELLRTQGVDPRQYKYLTPAGIIKLAGLKP